MNSLAVKLRSTQPEPLRRVLLADVVVTGAASILLTLAAGPLADLFDLPATLLRVAGIALVPWTAFVGVTATRSVIPRRGAWAVVIGNLAWTTASLLLIASDWVDPSAVGGAFVIVQALLVAGFAAAQTIVLRPAR